ncbi:WD40 repeat domain-containing protein [Limnoglobus roseus]|uniref:WD40 repeat domain-containing protein n=1 Tax=Limnoglobus roseus TaxID=2598579 RepID=A0A5C1AFP2_9BACT|nr:WD40 repeat domain-containing protein [Limnoglobus roseus]QEL15964.1 WD40 repeat domain-containing protein [Limnoglobus roseus]
MLAWQAFDKRVNYLAFSPDGTRVVACGDSEGIKVFDSFTGRELWFRTGDGRREHWHGHFTPDGKRVVLLFGNQILVLAADDGRELAKHSRVIAAFALLPDSQHLIAVTRAMDTCELKQLTLLGGDRIWKKVLTYKGGIIRLILSPDQRHLATISNFEGLLLDTATRKIRFKLPDKRFDNLSAHLAFSPDGRTLVYTAGSALHVCDVEAAKLRATVTRKGTGHGELAFTPDGRHLLRVGQGASVSLWDTAAWEPARSYNWKAGRLSSLTVSPDGTRAAVASERGKIVVWDLDV